MFCIAQFRHARNGKKLGNLIEWFVCDLGLKGLSDHRKCSPFALSRGCNRKCDWGSDRLLTFGLPIAVPLLVGTADAHRQHVLGVFQFPPGAGPLETVLDDVTVCTFDFARPYWQLGHERVSIVELPRAIGEIAMRRAHWSVVGWRRSAGHNRTVEQSPESFFVEQA